MKTYPRIAEQSLIRRGICCVCTKKATWRLDIQVSWFRGDDAIVQVCDDHVRLDARRLIEEEERRIEVARAEPSR